MRLFIISIIFMSVLGCAKSQYYTTYPLHGAVYKKDIPRATLLIAQGIDVNSQDIYGNTPILVAAESCNPSMIKFFAELGAKTNIINNEGNTLLHSTASCASKKNSEILALLRTMDIDVKAVNKSGQSAYFEAMEYMNMEMVALLRDKGITEKYTNGTASSFDESLRRPSFYTPQPGSYKVPKEKTDLYQLAIADCNHYAVPYKKGLLMVTGPVGYALGMAVDQNQVPKKFNSCMKLMGFPPK